MEVEDIIKNSDSLTRDRNIEKGVVSTLISLVKKYLLNIKDVAIQVNISETEFKVFMLI